MGRDKQRENHDNIVVFSKKEETHFSILTVYRILKFKILWRFHILLHEKK